MRRIWLTGASSGIGAALAELLLQRGYRLALSARTTEPLHALAERYPEQVLVAAGDLSDATQVRAIGERIAQVWGGTGRCDSECRHLRIRRRAEL
jgi:NADP-dependent 3-hydroxy acid dehydrogenase YdfG